jgi:hypothetical protein
LYLPTDFQCDTDILDPAQRCTLCVSRDLPCSERTFGREREKKLQKLRNPWRDFSGGSITKKQTNSKGLTRPEAAMSAVGAAATLAEMFPAFPTSELVSIAEEIADEALFSEHVLPLEELFEEAQ